MSLCLASHYSVRQKVKQGRREKTLFIIFFVNCCGEKGCPAQATAWQEGAQNSKCSRLAGCCWLVVSSYWSETSCPNKHCSDIKQDDQIFSEEQHVIRNYLAKLLPCKFLEQRHVSGNSLLR